MKIVQFTAENIKKLKLVDITPTKDFIQITGRNGSGKTSVLDAIWWALVGKAIQDKPIREGEEKAMVKLNLGTMTVTRRFSKGGNTLVVENADGFRAPSPQTMLDDIIGHLTFDPLEFSRMDAKKQFEALRKIAPITIDLDKLAKEDADDTEKRRDINRDIKTVEAGIAAITVPDDAPDEPVSIVELMGELQLIDAHNAEMQRYTQKKREVDAAIEATIEKITALQRQIEELEIKSVELQTTSGELCNIHIKPMKETSPIRAKIAGAEKINAAYNAKKMKDSMRAGLAKQQAESEALTAKMQARAEAKIKAMEETTMPIAGLAFGAGEVLFNGIPFLQLCSAEQLRVSVAIAMAANPKLKIIRIKDGSLLDDEGLKMIQEAAAEKDYQVWCERVDASGKVGIVMEDGEVVASDQEAEAAE